MNKGFKGGKGIPFNPKLDPHPPKQGGDDRKGKAKKLQTIKAKRANSMTAKPKPFDAPWTAQK